MDDGRGALSGDTMSSASELARCPTGQPPGSVRILVSDLDADGMRDGLDPCPTDSTNQCQSQLLSVSPATVLPGGTVTAAWTGIVSASATDWIGLYQPGADNTQYLAWIYVSCSQTVGVPRTSGSCQFVAPSTPGTYELRLLTNDGFTSIATRTFTVTAGGPAISVSPMCVTSGGSVTATWAGITTPSPTDWIGLYDAGHLQRRLPRLDVCQLLADSQQLGSFRPVFLYRARIRGSGHVPAAPIG